MTIKVEREALLRVIQRARTNSSFDEPISIDDEPISIADEEDYLLVDFRKPAILKIAPTSTRPLVESLPYTLSDDESSVFTLSTASISDADSSELIERRVSFAEELVTEEWTREYTPKEEISNLFYSTEETQRFRQEYRMERKLISELSIDTESLSVDNEELSELVASSCQTPSSAGRHRISRVVVLHNDKLETFFDPDQNLVKPEPVEDYRKAVPTSNDFFDNDSFWSGSITWY